MNELWYCLNILRTLIIHLPPYSKLMSCFFLIYIGTKKVQDLDKDFIVDTF